MRSPRRFVNELKYQIERYPAVRIFRFHDEIFTLSHEWVYEFCDIYGREVNLPFIIMVRVETLDYDIMRALREANCREIWVGVECGNEWLRREVLQRSMTNAQIARVFRMADVLGLATATFIMIGLPFETRQMVEETISFVRDLRPDRHQISMFYPFPGTHLYDVCKENGWLKEGAGSDVGSYFIKPIIDHPNMSVEETRRFHFRCVSEAEKVACRKRPRGIYDFIARMNEAAIRADRPESVDCDWFTDYFLDAYWLMMHPRAKVAYRLSVPADSVLVFDTMVSREVHEFSPGVSFGVLVNGTRIFGQFLDPRKRIGDRTFFHHEIRLSPYITKAWNPFARAQVDAIPDADGNFMAEVVFRTGPGPSGDTAHCKAGFGRPHIRRGADVPNRARHYLDLDDLSACGHSKVRELRSTAALDGFQIESSSRCDALCRHRFGTSYPQPLPEGNFEMGLMGRLQPFLRQMKHVELGGWGEPLLNPGIFDLIAQFRNAGCPRAILSTSGIHLDDGTCQKLVESGLTDISISIDCCSAETMGKVGGTSDFDAVVEGVRRLAKARSRLGSRTPRIEPSFIIMRSNVRELPRFVRLMAECGADEVALGNLIAMTKEDLDEILYDGFYGREVEASMRDECLAEAADVARAAGIGLLPMGPLSISGRLQECFCYVTSTPFISWNGDVSPCCFLAQPVPRVMRDERVVSHGALKFGNLREESLEEIWTSYAYTRFREMHRAEAAEQCEDCPAVYLLERKPGGTRLGAGGALLQR